LLQPGVQAAPCTVPNHLGHMLCYGNGRKERIVRKVSQAWLAEESGFHRTVVGQALGCLVDGIKVIGIHRFPERRKDGSWTTTEYHVPPISSLDIGRVQKRIDRLWRKNPEVFRLRPDLDGRYTAPRE